MASSRGFIWLDDTTSTSSSGSFDGTNIVMNNNSVLQFIGGDTIITNQSIDTVSISVEEITNNTNPVDFPDGISTPDIYYNNAYEYTLGAGMTHWNPAVMKQNLTAETLIKVDRIESFGSPTLEIDQNVSIAGSLTVLGTTTSLSSVNTEFSDRYLVLNSGYTGSGLSSGFVSINSTTGIAYSLTGSFTTTTVGTVAPDGLAVGALISVGGSTSNNSIYEVLTHTANVLTIRSSPVQAYSLNSFVAEAAAGTVRVYVPSGLEFSSTGVPTAIIGNARHSIAYNTAAPSFTNMSLTGLTQDDTKTQILCKDDATHQLFYLDSASLYTPPGPTISSFSPNILNSAANVLGTVPLYFNVDEYQRKTTLDVGAFNITLAISSNTLRIVGGEYLCLYQAYFSILLNIAGSNEECFAVHKYDSGDSSLSELVIARKNGLAFPVGTITHGVSGLASDTALIPICCHTYRN